MYFQYTAIRQRFVALRIANESRALVHPSTVEFFPLVGKFLSKVFHNLQSRPRTPSTDTTRGVKEVRGRAAASEYFFFFSSSAEVRMAVTTPLECDGAHQTTPRSGAAIHSDQRLGRALCKKLDIRYRIICVYFEFTHQESHLRNEPVSHCVYFEYPQPHHVRLEGFTKQCLRIPLCDTLHRIRCWVRTPILFMVY